MLVMYRPPITLATLLENSSWPIALVCFCIIYKTPISRLIGRIRVAKVAGAELEIDANTTEEVEAFARVAQPISSKEPDQSDFDQRIAKLDPAAAVVSYWSRVYEALLSETKRLGFEHGTKPTTTASMINWLASHSDITSLNRQHLLYLFYKRNNAVHGSMEERLHITTGDAIEFASMCQDAIDSLRLIKAHN
jgi:hypothetical protein